MPERKPAGGSVHAVDRGAAEVLDDRVRLQRDRRPGKPAARARPGRDLTLLFGAERSLCPSQDPGLFFGILPFYLRNIWRSRELV